ncbi:MAG: HD domain-containing protein [Fimbriimonadaceae bacterium]|nr:HD domain-containing protein [Fimbriimonadaceae bacterium]
MIRDLVFSGNPSGLVWSRAWSDELDGVIQRIYDATLADFGQLQSIALIATGGYGRQELSPYSDLDVAVVPTDEQLPGLDTAIRALFNALHAKLSAELGLKVDYAYRVLSDAPGFDPTTRTGLLEMRHITGNPHAFESLGAAFWETFSVGDFLIAKIEERRLGSAKTNSTPFVVTPHLKEGSGGLRDFQAANWVRLALGETTIAGPSLDYDQILKIRNCLHLLREREVDQLTHLAQGELADRFGWEPRLMMTQLHAAMESLHRYWRETVSGIAERSFALADNVTASQGKMHINSGATPSEAAIGVANAIALGIRRGKYEQTLQLGPPNPGQALRALMQGEQVIRELEEAAVLKVLLPELTETKALLPDDHSHIYTVFEHSVQAIRNLENLPPFHAELYRRIQDKGALWLATLMHDVGKSNQESSHSISGEKMVHQMAERWQLDQDRADAVGWLVRNHLLMSHTIRMRDVAQPETIREFVSQMPSIEHLLMLTVLTWADSNAVGPGIWTSAQDGFLQELCERAENAMRSESPPIADAEVARSMLRRSLKHGQHSETEVQAFLQIMPAHYVLSTSPDDVLAHLELAAMAQRGQIVVAFSPNAKLGATDLTLAAPDQPGLLSRALGLIYALDISVIGLRASTTSGAQPIALDVFTLSFGGGPVPPSTGSALKQHLLSHLDSDDAILEILRERGKTIDVKPGEAALVYHFGHPGLLEIRGKRGRGMAYRLSRIIAREGWNVLGARVGQWAGQSTASFTLTGPGGADLMAEDIRRAFGE